MNIINHELLRRRILNSTFIGFISISLCSIISILIQETIQWPNSNALKFHLFFARHFGWYKKKYAISNRRMLKVWSPLQKCEKKANKPPCHHSVSSFSFPSLWTVLMIKMCIVLVVVVGFFFDCQLPHSCRLWICVFIFCLIRGGRNRNSSHSQFKRKQKKKASHRDEKVPQCKFYSKWSFVRMGYICRPTLYCNKNNKYTQSRY